MALALVASKTEWIIEKHIDSSGVFTFSVCSYPSVVWVLDHTKKHLYWINSQMKKMALYTFNSEGKAFFTNNIHDSIWMTYEVAYNNLIIKKVEYLDDKEIVVSTFICRPKPAGFF